MRIFRWEVKLWGCICQLRLKNPQFTGRKVHHLAEISVYKFSRSIENGTGW